MGGLYVAHDVDVDSRRQLILGTRSIVFVGLCLTISIANPLAICNADEIIPPQELVGRTITLKLRSVTTPETVEVVRVTEGRPKGTIGMLTVRDPKTEKTRPLMASMVTWLSPGTGTTNYVYDQRIKGLVPDDLDIQAVLLKEVTEPSLQPPPTVTPGRKSHASKKEPEPPSQETKQPGSEVQGKAAEADQHADNSDRIKLPGEDLEPSSEDAPSPLTRAQTDSKLPAGDDGKGKKPVAKPRGKAASKREVATEPLPEIPLRPGTRRWPEQSKEDREKAIAEHKEFLKKIVELFPTTRFTFRETEFFLIFSDLSPRDVNLLAPYMDAMYRRLATMFDVKPETNIFRGKGVLVLFSTKAAYGHFQVKLCNSRPEMAVNRPAVVNYESNGNALIGGHAEGDSLMHVVSTMVHETVHAFIFRYKTSAWVPSWANEGLATFVQISVVPQDADTRQTMQEAVMHLRRGGAIGGIFEKNYIGFVENSQAVRIKYGTTAALTRYMIATDSRRYRQFIEGIKAGMSDRESVQNAYGISPEELLQHFGRSIGVPNLRPQ